MGLQPIHEHCPFSAKFEEITQWMGGIDAKLDNLHQMAVRVDEHERFIQRRSGVEDFVRFVLTVTGVGGVIRLMIGKH